MIQRGECLSKVFKDGREIRKESVYFYVIVVIYKFVFHISYVAVMIYVCNLCKSKSNFQAINIINNNK